MGEKPREEEFQPKSYVDQMIEKMNQSMQEIQKDHDEFIAEHKRIREKLGRREALTQEEKDYIEKSKGGVFHKKEK